MGGVNHAASQACKQGGWREQQREDGTRFTNQGRCVSYAVHGGVLAAVVPIVTISFVVSTDPDVPRGLLRCDSDARDFDPTTEYVGTLLVDGLQPVAPAAVHHDGCPRRRGGLPGYLRSAARPGRSRRRSTDRRLDHVG